MWWPILLIFPSLVSLQTDIQNLKVRAVCIDDEGRGGGFKRLFEQMIQMDRGLFAGCVLTVT